MNRIEMTGVKIHSFTVLEAAPKREGHGKILWWKCRCDCGKIIEVRSLALRRKTRPTKSCGCRRVISVRKKMWQGCGELSKTYFTSIKLGAESRNLEFNITIEECWELFLKQNRKCGLTGLSLIFPKKIKDSSEQTASLDRIDSRIGYTKDNIMWVHKTINRLKMAYSNEELIYWANLISEHNKRKNDEPL